MRIGGCFRLRLTKYVGGYLAHNTCHQMAVALKACKVQITVLRQVHLTAFNDGKQVACFYLVAGSQRYQGFHHRVAGLTSK